MDIRKAKESVVAAGIELVKTGLIERTWGNVSCRIDENRFAITPSGMAYETLRPEDIVVVNIHDLKYEGHIKPSSEKGIHAQVYKLKPHMGFVIHTHQTNASIAGILGRDVETESESAKRLSTKKLCKNTTAALERSEGRAVLMRNHGALCFGEDLKAAFEAAKALEEECARFIQKPPALRSEGLGQSRRQKNGICIFENNGFETAIDIAAGKTAGGGAVSQQALLHAAIYRARPEISVIKGSAMPYTLAAAVKTVKPLLDDFAQIIGASARSVKWRADSPDNASVIRALRGRDAVLISGYGAICVASTEEDAEAVKMILEKGCMAALTAQAEDGIRPIPSFECLLMRNVYKLKYSKKANQKPQAE